MLIILKQCIYINIKKFRHENLLFIYINDLNDYNIYTKVI
jgi:hypothetical protein